MLNRREMLQAVGVAAASLPAARVDAAKRKLEIRRYRTLGRTGERVSDLSLGGSSSFNEGVVKHALQLGVTYIDTAPDYGSSERIIGRGWKRAGVARDKFHLTTKICSSYGGHARRGTSEKKIIRLVESSLRRLKMDYVDNLLVHSVGSRGDDDVERLKDPEMLAAVEKLKKQGKVRHLGCSTHGPHKPLDVLRYAITSGHYDLIMPAYNIYKWPGLDEVLKLAHQKGVGVIAMKTLRGGRQAREAGVLPKGEFAHAAFKWVWSNPAVAGLVISIDSISELENYVAASGGKLAQSEHRALQRAFAATSQSVCRIGCGECLARCSQGVEIPTVFRQDMYYRDYGRRVEASRGYAELARLGVAADRCRTCANQTCVDACGYGVPIREGLLDADRRLA